MIIRVCRRCGAVLFAVWRHDASPIMGGGFCECPLSILKYRTYEGIGDGVLVIWSREEKM